MFFTGKYLCIQVNTCFFSVPRKDYIYFQCIEVFPSNHWLNLVELFFIKHYIFCLLEDLITDNVSYPNKIVEIVNKGPNMDPCGIPTFAFSIPNLILHPFPLYAFKLIKGYKLILWYEFKLFLVYPCNLPYLIWFLFIFTYHWFTL